MFDLGIFIEFLKEHKIKGASQQSVGRVLRLAQAYISQIINGERPFKEEYIELLRSAYGDSVVDQFIEQVESKQPIISYSSGVPYYDVDFIGGFDLVLNDQTIKPVYLIDFQRYNSADCWCNVTGKSMEPEISHGDMIALKEINNWRAFLPYGEVYAIVTTEHRTIKKVTGSMNIDKLLLIPLNQALEFQPQEIDKEIIVKVYRVLGCVKKI